MGISHLFWFLEAGLQKKAVGLVLIIMANFVRFCAHTMALDLNPD